MSPQAIVSGVLLLCAIAVNSWSPFLAGVLGTLAIVFAATDDDNDPPRPV